MAADLDQLSRLSDMLENEFGLNKTEVAKVLRYATETRSKSKKLNIRVSDAEYRIIFDKAHNAGVSLSTYVREAIFGKSNVGDENDADQI